MTDDARLYRVIDRLALPLRGKKALAASVESLGDLLRMDPFEMEFLCGTPLRGRCETARAVQLVEQEERQGIGALPLKDPRYPALLKEIHDPPFVLYYRGDLPRWEGSVAVVGTRRPTADALREAWQFGAEQALAGRTTVSGLALGIDAAAHRGALAAGGCTVAVLAGGLMQVYPAAHRRLAARILETGGALVSEFAGSGIPGRYLFPRRNRIISGLCSLTVVAQAPRRSGALITADFALDQGRDVAVLPAGLDPVRGEGTLRLAADGAPVAGKGEIPFGSALVPCREPRSGAELARFLEREMTGDLFSGYGGCFVRSGS